MPDLLNRSYSNILADELLLFAALSPQYTDINDGAVSRSIVEAAVAIVAAEESGLQQQTSEMIATGIYRAFNFVPIPAAAATGTLSLTFTSTLAATSIPAGQVFQIPFTSKYYTATQAITVPISTTSAAVPVACTIVGTVGNAAASSITSIVGTIPYIVFPTCTNANALINGADAETQEQLRNRFASERITERRATKGAVEGAAKRVALYDSFGNITERVVQAACYDQTPGTATLYIHNGSSTTPSTPLITQTTNVINGYTDGVTGIVYDGYKAAGVAITVSAPSLLPVTITSVTANFTVDPSYDKTTVDNLAFAAAYAAIGVRTIGQPLYLSELYQAMMRVKGLLDVAIYTSPAMISGAITPANNQVIVGPNAA